MSTDSALPRHADVVIAGGGFAGAATACFLARRGALVCLLEAEDQFGVHASGLNAALVRQLVPDPVTGAILRRSAAAIGLGHGFPPDRVDFRRTGSLLLVGEGGEGPGLVEAARDAVAAGLDCAIVGRDEAVSRVPPLAEASFDHAIATGSDGVLDISALLWRYLAAARMAGARLLPSCPVTGVEVSAGRVRGVATPLGRIGCDVLVDAAGAWANGLAALAGLPALPMTPYRRHLAVTPTVSWADGAWPFVWHTGQGWYFRPEVGGLLLCACDQDVQPAAPAVRDPAVLEVLAEKLQRHVPALAGLAVKRWWAGLRTITSDGRFIVGPDPRLPGFAWVAGLGGHGMTGSAAVGELAAARILGDPVDPAVREATDPGRFAT